MLDALNPEKVCFILYKARELNSAVEPTDDSGSNASDDAFSSALTTANDRPVRAELGEFLAALDEDESTELVALCWVGRGDFDKDEWSTALQEAAGREGPPTPRYLLDMERLADYLEVGMAAFDLDCDDFEDRELP